MKKPVLSLQPTRSLLLSLCGALASAAPCLASTEAADETAAAPEAATAMESRPVIMFTDGDLERMRRRVASGEAPWDAAWRDLKMRADACVKRPPSPSASGDFRELANLLIDDGRRAKFAALAWQATGDTIYRDAAIDYLMAWAAPDDPPLGSVIAAGSTVGIAPRDTAGVGLHWSKAVLHWAEAYALVFDALTGAQRATAREWFGRMVFPIMASRETWIAWRYFNLQLYNNHLSEQNIGLLCLGLVLGRDDLVEYVVASEENPRDLAEMIDGAILMPERPDSQFFRGDPSRECRAGEIYDRYRVTDHFGDGSGDDKGINYALAHTWMMLHVARIADNNGLGDSFQHTGPFGQNLSLPLIYYAPAFVEGDPAALGDYYANSRYEPDAWNHIAIYEIGHRHYPDVPAITEALRHGNRLANSPRHGGTAYMLAFGPDLEGQ